MTIEEMEKYGVIDYYLELKKYINLFLERNYPLTEEDMKAIVNDKETENIKTRNEVKKILTASLMISLEEQMNKNKLWLKELEKNPNLIAMTADEEQKLIFNIKQQMLSTLWEYKQHKIKEMDINIHKTL